MAKNVKKKTAAPKKVIAQKKAVLKKAAPKKVVSKKAVPAKTIPQKAPVTLPLPATKKYVQFFDSSFFFPTSTTEGYADDFQAGRYTTTDEGTLQAPILLPVGAKIKTITIYYKNTSDAEMQANIVRKSIDHWASTEEYLVSYEGLPAGTGIAPDYFAATVINHFANAGKIADKYLYYIMISNCGSVGETRKNVRGMRIEYTY